MEVMHGARTRTYWGDHMLFSLVEIDVNSKVPNHTHPHEQGGVVTECKIEMGINGEVRTLKAGDMYIIPGDVGHYAECGDIQGLGCLQSCPGDGQSEY